jgi:hypothetical protein
MAVLYWRESEQHKPKKSAVFYIGLLLYVLSFFLPAVDFYDSGHLAGWMCAWMAFYGLVVPNVSLLAVFGGLINPAAVTYILLQVRNRAPRACFALSAAILLFIPITWLSLILMHLRIWVGHVVWITGLLLMIEWHKFRMEAIAGMRTRFLQN